jgi:glycosyltransferase involved in cell wall biosynthesis
MLGGYLFRGDTLVVISDYSKRFIEATVGRFFPDLKQRLKRIHNGMDWEHFKETTPDEIYKIVPREIRQNYHVIAHPHRPEDTKGMWQTIDVVEKLAQKRQDFRVIFPRWIGAEADAGVQDFYERVNKACVERGIADYFISHAWVSYDLLPQYYSLADVTLSLGSFVESFGNAVYESLGCGTPSVVARIATHRELLPEDLVDKVDFDDTDTAADIVDEILSTERRTSRGTLDYLKVNYNFTDQLEAYAETIENARVHEPMKFQPQMMTPDTAFKLAPWCYLTNGRIYHDFKATYYEDSILLFLLETGLSVQAAQDFGVSEEQFEGWYREGYIIPDVKKKR